jgi:hypothetical protein
MWPHASLNINLICVGTGWKCGHHLQWLMKRRTIIQDNQKVSVHLTQCIQTIPTQLMIWRWPSQNTFGMWTVLQWTRSSRTQFGMTINIWRLGGGTLWTLLVTFCTVIIRCTETFWSPCINVSQRPHMIFPTYLHTLYLCLKCAFSFPHKSYMLHPSHPQTQWNYWAKNIIRLELKVWNF